MQGQAATAVESPQYTIKIGQLAESRTNPRKAFAADSLSDLTNSIKENGILVPLLVRLLDTRSHENKAVFEIVDGARRYRAAKAAKLDEVPVIVRELDDDEALEIQVIANLQREDVHPLEEAEGYAQLVRFGGPQYEIADLAAKVGKSETYIRQRMKLADLIPAAKKAFVEEKLTPGHAVLIARLAPSQQEDALEYATARFNPPTVKELDEWIKDDIFLDLHSAPFAIGDAKILPGVPACVDCPKRTGYAPALFADVKKKDTCTDAECFHKKAEAYVQIRTADAKKEGRELVKLAAEYGRPKVAGALSHDLWQDFEHKPAKCPSAEQGIVIDGRNQGKQIAICRDTKCKVHGKEARRTKGGTVDPYREDRLKNERKRRVEMEVRRLALSAIAQQPPKPIGKLKRAHWNLLAKFVLARMPHDMELPLAQALGIEPKKSKGYGGSELKDYGAAIAAKVNAAATVDELVRWMLLAAVSPDLICSNYQNSWTRKDLEQLGELEGVSVAKVEANYKALLKAKKAAKSAKKAKAKK